jgi:arsenite methyltransferase
MTTRQTDPATLREQVRARYAAAALQVTSGHSDCGCGQPADCGCDRGCCGPAATEEPGIGAGLYAQLDREQLPDAAVLASLGCGNPTAVAELRQGEVVLDLGSGGGIDVLLSAKRVGPSGKAYGLDMTEEMLALARANAAEAGAGNVEWLKGPIEAIPLPAASVDVVISNCVLNLSPDKPQVWRDIARVLKPGGRVAVSDLALLKPLPHAVADMLEALVGCIAGAPLVTDTERMMREAGLVDIALEPKADYVETMRLRKSPLYEQIAAHIPEGTTPADYVTSLNITARKPT